ncbi:MAG: tRNA (adenosine(37)-N6)-threonylcarbamoyltransferase complex transferase subunit TsaD [Actinobacteria bacterium]|nr:tRNA (adenosine(37)-N6)-threonylcarbamoyltransferase complex transferase subunit TsaD [Actinomycetota bacterium]MCL5445261.1 tRNA (adenosine(37)-N6)-threonylcarbamoyltransferase complex transferase subunit TsaD [Actinomycetota bacterium]
MTNSCERGDFATGDRSASECVLGIETSCDETAAAVVEGGRSVISSVVSSQVDLHARFGGVVPELAGRAHLDLLNPVVEEALEIAGRTPESPRIRAVAVTYGPGLVGSLLVGLAGAKALALAWDVPLVAVNHLEAHLFAPLIEQEDPEFPLVVLLVSGGHTLLIEMDAPGSYRLLGKTLDDAAGEAFDKVARFLGLGYPGGPAIDNAARGGSSNAYRFPRSMLNEGYNFSFSGLKTSVIRAVQRDPTMGSADVAASFQEAVVEVLVTKAIRAARDVGAKALCIGGGVAANSVLRERIEEACSNESINAYLPSRAMCTDNAAMVAAAGWWRLVEDGPSSLSVGAVPNLALFN